MRGWAGMRMMSPLLSLGLACAVPPVLAQQAAPKQPQASAPAAQQKPTTQKHHRKPKLEPVAEPAPPVPTVAPNMLDQPASPATVKAADNELTVTAENSSLSQILHLVS